MTGTLNPYPEPSKRLDVVDSLRGFALLAIVLIHNIDHYNMMYYPETLPDWMVSLDKAVENSIFCLFAGKA